MVPFVRLAGAAALAATLATGAATAASVTVTFGTILGAGDPTTVIDLEATVPGVFDLADGETASGHQELSFTALFDETGPSTVPVDLTRDVTVVLGSSVMTLSMPQSATADKLSGATDGGPATLDISLLVSDADPLVFDFGLAKVTVDAGGTSLGGGLAFQPFLDETGEIPFTVTYEEYGTSVVPLPAGMALMLPALGALLTLRRRG